MFKISKRLRSILVVGLMLVLASCSSNLGTDGEVTAQGEPHFLGGVIFSLGSLIANGALAGLGSTDVTVTLNATGVPVVSCSNKGGNQAPGQNPPKVSASGKQYLVHSTYTKNGKTSFFVETSSPAPFTSAQQAGCPNNNWTAQIVFVYWTNATITVSSTATGTVFIQQNYTCTTTRNPDTVSCSPI